MKSGQGWHIEKFSSLRQKHGYCHMLIWSSTSALIQPNNLATKETREIEFPAKNAV